jgi:hypothetical protein
LTIETRRANGTAFAYAMPLPFYCGKLLSFDFGLPQSVESRLFLISAFRVNPKATIFQFQLSAM